MESPVQQTGGDDAADDPLGKRPPESQGGPATGDFDEDSTVATLLETRVSWPRRR